MRIFKLLIQRLQILVLISLLGCDAKAQTHHYESLILPGDTFSYLVPTKPINTNWKFIIDKNELWPKGATGIGYGDNDDKTIIKNTVSVYITKYFTVYNKSIINSLLLDIDYDDGFVAYLNGKEIARNNVEGNPPAYDQPSITWREATLYYNQTPERYSIDKDLLNNGLNKLAIQVHNQSENSSDLSIIPTLSVGITNSQRQYRAVPNWFIIPPEKVVLTKSHLPIVVVNTIDTNEIPFEPKVEAEMYIIYNADSAFNHVADLENKNALHFSGKIGIEVRGSSSSLLAKKQYALTTLLPNGENNNVSLFGFPAENDWILNGLAYDSSLIRDYINYRLSERIGMYASRGKYCELILNGQYAGIYLFQEKLKVDDDRIKISKISNYDNDGAELTGGYIIKADKIEGTDPLAWSMPNGIGWNTNYVYEYPKPNIITNEQAEYIENYFWDLAEHAKNSDIISGYPSKIDVPSFVKFMILNELGSNGDAYQFSTFHHKDRNGKLNAGPIWDMNLTFGNDLFFWDYDRSKTDIWQHYDFENVGAAYWHELFEQRDFKCSLTKQWQKLSKKGAPLNAQSINELIDSAANIFGDALIREQQTWQSVTQFKQEIEQMKIWTTARVNWMSNELNKTNNCAEQNEYPLVISKIHYHPNSVDGYAENHLEYIEITNASNNKVDLTGIYFGGYDIVYHFRNNASIQANEKIYLANNAQIFNEFYGKVAFGEYYKNLSNSGYNLKLLDAFGNIIDQVPYQDSLPWPTEADGGGYCLELIDIFSNNKLAQNWRAATPLLTEPSSDAFNVALFPNPTTGLINVRSDRTLEQIEVSNISGKIIMNINVNDSVVPLDFSMLDAGIYTLTLVSQNGLKKIKKVSLITN
ncbi:MAG: CotH kinase family protein [Bacteroidia bacterium]